MSRSDAASSILAKALLWSSSSRAGRRGRWRRSSRASRQFDARQAAPQQRSGKAQAGDAQPRLSAQKIGVCSTSAQFPVRCFASVAGTVPAAARPQIGSRAACECRWHCLGSRHEQGLHTRRRQRRRVADIGERPVSTHRNLVTSAGLAQIDEASGELREDWRRPRPTPTANASRPCRATCATGRRAARTPNCRSPSPDSDVVRFGMTVTIEGDDGKRKAWKIVGEDEADAAKGSVSHVSPMALCAVRQDGRRNRHRQRQGMGNRQAGGLIRTGADRLEVIAKEGCCKKACDALIRGALASLSDISAGPSLRRRAVLSCLPS